MSKPPPPAPTASAIGPCPTVIKIVGRPGTGSLPSTFAPPDHPLLSQPGRVAQSVGHLTRKSGVLGSIPGLATYFRSPSAFSRRAVVSYWRKYVHKVLINRFGDLSLPRKSVDRLTDRPDMTLDVYRGRKTTIQQQLSFLSSPSLPLGDGPI